jgi:hypothetical protein
MISPKLVYLSKSEARQVCRLLDVLCVHLDSAIESTLLPGQTVPDEEIDRDNVTQDRIDVIAAKAMREKLTAQMKGKK